MPRKRINSEKAIYALKRMEGGARGVEVCREMRVSEQTLYNMSGARVIESLERVTE